MYFRAENAQKRSLYNEVAIDENGYEVEDADEDVLQQIIDREDYDAAIKALARVKESNGIVLHLRVIEGFSYEEISDILDLNNSTVRNRYQRGVEQLREEYYKVIGGEDNEGQ